MRARAARWLGLLAAAAGVAFVVRALARQWSATRSVLGDASPGWLAAGFVLALAALVAMALPWRSAQELVGPALSRFDTVTLYFRGEIGKYVPGSVWALVGRAELAGRAGLARTVAYAGVALSLAALFLACAAVATVALASPGAAGGVTAGVAWLLLVLPVGLVALHPRVTGRVWARLGIEPPALARVGGLIVRYLPAWVLVAAATLCLTRAVTPSVPVRQLVLATTLAWLAGFVAVGAPGGLGVREAVFVSLLTRLPSEVALAAALLARLAFVVADAAGAVAATALRARPPRTSP